jgi:hypothetical protein
MTNETEGQAKQRLAKEMSAPAKTAKKPPARLPLDAIGEEPLVFQPRQGGIDRDHVKEIAKGIGGEGVLILRVGERWVVVDGHHRLAAYRAMQAKTGKPQMVPVTVLKVHSLDEAIREAGRRNSRDKLSMSLDDKTAFAWGLVVDGNGAKRVQAQAASIAESTVARMRAVSGRWKAKGINAEALKAWGWDEARRRDQGVEHGEISPDALEAMAQDWAKRLSGTFTNKLTKAPGVFARAIQIYSPALPASLIESFEWSDVLDMTVQTALQERDYEQEQGESQGPEVVVDF